MWCSTNDWGVIQACNCQVITSCMNNERDFISNACSLQKPRLAMWMEAQLSRACPGRLSHSQSLVLGAVQVFTLYFLLMRSRCINEGFGLRSWKGEVRSYSRVILQTLYSPFRKYQGALVVEHGSCKFGSGMTNCTRSINYSSHSLGTLLLFLQKKLASSHPLINFSFALKRLFFSTLIPRVIH